MRSATRDLHLLLISLPRSEKLRYVHMALLFSYLRWGGEHFFILGRGVIKEISDKHCIKIELAVVIVVEAEILTVWLGALHNDSWSNVVVHKYKYIVFGRKLS